LWEDRTRKLNSPIPKHKIIVPFGAIEEILQG
jgi:hypothetical protein